MNNNEDTLSKFGYNFQVKSLSALLKHRNYLMQVFDIIKTEYYDNDSLRFILTSILTYFKEYKSAPTLEVFKVQISNIQVDLLKSEVLYSLRKVLEFVETSDDLEYIKAESLSFFKNQELKRAILTSVDLLKRGDYDGIKHEVDSALKRGIDQNLGLDYTIDIDTRYSENEIQKGIPTGWELINDITNGGLPPGKLGVIMAGAGIGKSWFLIHIGAASLKLGHNVLHYTLELDENYVGRRYDAILTGIPLDDLKYSIDSIKKKLAKYQSKLIIKEFPTKSVSVQGLRSHIEKSILVHGKPNLLILDYADLLKLPKYESLRKDEMLQMLYEDLRGLAGELGLPIWTASQINRSGMSQDIIEADSVSESFAKMFTADFVMSVSRKTKDKLNNTARTHIIKNRLGPDGLIFPTLIDTALGKIELYNEKSKEGVATLNNMQTDQNFEKTLLKNRYQQLMDRNTQKTDIF